MEPFLALAAPAPTPLQFVDAALTIGTVVLQIMLLLFAIRVYRANRSVASQYLLWACVFYVVAEVAVFAIGFFPAFLFHKRVYPPLVLRSRSDIPDPLFSILYPCDKMPHS
jgi:hypothetical protein